jgi:hypothetical protein
VNAEALLLDERVGRREVDLQRGRQADRPQRAVRSERRAVGLGERADAAGLGDPARVGRVRLDHGDPRVEHRPELPARVQPLTGRDRDRRRRHQPRERVAVLRHERLLDEQRRQRLELGEETAGHRRGHAAVEVEGDVAVVAQRVPDACDPGDGRGHLRLRLEEAEGPGGVHLDRREPRLHLRERVLGRLHGIVAADPSVDPHAVAHVPAEQRVHRDAAGLAGDVPQRLVDPRDGAREDRPASVEAALRQRLPQVLDPQRVRPDHDVGQLVDRGAHRLGPPLDDGLSPSDDALVGLHAQEQPARDDEERLHAGDAHRTSFLRPSSTGRSRRPRRRWWRP